MTDKPFKRTQPFVFILLQYQSVLVLVMGDDEIVLDGSTIVVQYCYVAHLCCRSSQQRRYDVNFPREAVAINQWKWRRVCVYILYHIYILAKVRIGYTHKCPYIPLVFNPVLDPIELSFILYTGGP